MARKICRYTLKAQEQKRWETDGMQGWRRALEACVEDEAREQGSLKYVIYDRGGSVLVKDEVKALPEFQP